ncbi:MAG: hypothetical protein EXS13_14455 [Planctomycetes bacterium]|nr:hypothetical protein [Planctomycetota bacterium]
MQSFQPAPHRSLRLDRTAAVHCLTRAMLLALSAVTAGCGGGGSSVRGPRALLPDFGVASFTDPTVIDNTFQPLPFGAT